MYVQQWQKAMIMLHLDFNWDLDKNGILFDEELNVEKLGWRDGDSFELVTDENGRRRLVKIDPFMKFIKEGREYYGYGSIS